MGTRTSNHSTPPDADPKGKKGRRLLVAGILLALVLVLVALVPTLLSTGPGRARIFAYAGTLLGGRVSADALRLSWFGRQKVTGLTVETPEGGDAIRGLDCTLHQGLASLAFSRDRIGRIALAGGDGRVESLRQLGRARPAAEEQPDAPDDGAAAPPGPLPLEVTISGFKLHARDATVQIADATFKSAETGDTFDARFEIRGDGKSGTASIDGTVVGLSSDWKGPDAIGLDARLKTDAVPLAAVWEMLAALDVGIEGGGTLAGTADVKRNRAGRMTLTADLTGQDVWATGEALRGDRPELASLDLNADMAVEGRTVNVKALDLTTPVATAKAQGAFDLEALLASAEQGAAAPGDAGEATATVEADLAPIARMLPNTLGLHKDVKLTGGKLAAKLTARPGAAANALTFNADVTGVTGRRGDRDIVLSPMKLAADLLMDSEGVNVRQVTAASAFGKLQGSGRLDAFSMDADLNLDQAVQEVGQFVELEGFDAKGDLTASAKTTGTWGERVHVEVAAEATDLILNFGEGSIWREHRATLATRADLTFAGDDGLTAINAKPLEIEASGGTLSGSADLRREADQWTVDAEATGSGSLARLSSQVAGYLGRADQRQQGVGLNGTWHLTATARGKPAGKLSANVGARTTDLAYVRPAAENRPAEATRVQDLDMDAQVDLLTDGQAREVVVRKLQVDGHGMTVRADGTVAGETGEGGSLAADGRADARFDLAKTAGLLKSFGVVSADSELAGTADFSAAAATRERRVEAGGTLELADLDVYLTDTNTRINEKTMTVPVKAVYYLDSRTLDLTLDRIAGKLAQGKVRAMLTPRGDLVDVQADADLAFDGSRMRRALGTTLPQDMDMAGQWYLTASASGPLAPKEKNWNRQIRRLHSQGVIRVGELTYRGVKTEGEKQEIQWLQGDGKITRTADRKHIAALGVNEGTVQVDGRVELEPETPRFRVDEPVEFVQEVALTGELAQNTLAYLSPLLGSSVSPRGRLSMNINSANIPMGGNVLETASFDGIFSVADFQTTFRGPFARLARWLGAKNEIEPQTLGPVHVMMKKGILHLDEQAVTLGGGLKLRLDGTVRASDGGMNLMVSMPLTEGLLEKFGVKADSRLLLADKLVRVPLTGTVKSPRLNEKRLGEAVMQAIADIFRPGEKGIENIRDTLRDLFKRDPDDEPEEAPQPKPEENPPEKPKEPPPEEKDPEDKAREEIRDFFEDLLKGDDDD